jgi:peptide/nickel transport system substrate-binding protein
MIMRTFLALLVTTSLILTIGPVFAAPSRSAITVGVPVDPPTLSPEETALAPVESIFSHILEPLVALDAKGGQTRPWLAESWRWLSPTNLELRLKRGVRFSNGEPFDAAAAKYSIEILARGGPQAVLIPKGLYKETTVVDDSTVRISLNQPYSPLVSVLARGGYMYPPRYHRELGKVKFGQQPVGTGPYKLRQRVKDSHIVLEANRTYWGGPRKVSEIVFRIIPEVTARIAAVERGEIDIAYDLPPTAVARLRRNQNLVVYSISGQRKFFVRFETNREPTPLDDPRVRIALNMAVDKHAIIKSLFQEQAQALPGQYLLPNEFGYNPNIRMFSYDPERAKALLARAGYPDGFEMEIQSTLGRYALDKELGETVVAYLQKIGVRVKHDAMEWGAFVRRRDADLLSNNLVGTLVPPDPHFIYLTTIRGAPRLMHEFPETYDQLVLQAAEEVDQKKRESIYMRLAVMVNSNPPWLFLHAPNDIYAVNKRVQGFTPRFDQILRLYDVTIR